MQRADILGGRTFAMRIWLKPEQMAALRHLAVARCSDALAENNYLSALGRTKGSMVSVNLVANTDLADGRGVPPAGGQGGRTAAVVRLGDIADVVLGAENYDQDVRFNGETATFMGIWVLPTANSLEVIGRVREAMPEIQAQLPAGMKAGIPYDSTEYIRERHPRGAEDAARDAADRHRWSSSCSWLGALGDHPGGRDPDLADRRGVPDDGRPASRSTC